MRKYKITYKRVDLRDGVDYSVIVNTNATTPEQVLQEVRQNTQHENYPAISHTENIRVEPIES
jgi:hypothetical protein